MYSTLTRYFNSVCTGLHYTDDCLPLILIYWHQFKKDPVIVLEMSNFEMEYFNTKSMKLDAVLLWSMRLALTNLPLMPHICVSESDRQCFRYRLVAYSALSHYLNQCLVIINRALTNKLWRNQNAKLFIHENASENIVCQITAILSGGDELIDNRVTTYPPLESTFVVKWWRSSQYRPLCYTLLK